VGENGVEAEKQTKQQKKKKKKNKKKKEGNDCGLKKSPISTRAIDGTKNSDN